MRTHTQSLKRAEQLVAVTDAAYRGARAKLARGLAAEVRLRAAEEALALAWQARSTSNVDPAMLAGADIRWRAWLDREGLRLRQERAQLRAQLAEERAALVRVFARAEAARLAVGRLAAKR